MVLTLIQCFEFPESILRIIKTSEKVEGRGCAHTHVHGLISVNLSCWHFG